MDNQDHVLQIKFDSRFQLEDFATWLCNIGQKDYSDYLRCQAMSQVDFIFHHPQDLSFLENDKRRYEKAIFINHNIIFVKGDSK